MRGFRIGKRVVDNLPAGEKPYFVWDSDLKGFGVKVLPSGRKTYVADYRTPGSRKTHRFTIGVHGSPWTPDLARKEAGAKLLLACQGVDPNADKRRRRTETIDFVFGAFADRFVEHYLRSNWKGSLDRAESVLRCHAKPFFKGQDVRDITKADCAAFIDSLSDREATARKAAEVVGKMFAWAENRGEVERNPMDRVPRPKPGIGRERVLTDEELARVWKAADRLSDHPYGAAVRFLILSGQRRGEVCEMRWDDLDLDRQLFDLMPSKHKSKRGNVIPLTDAMIDILSGQPRLGPVVFSVHGDKALSNHTSLKRKLDREIVSDGADPLTPWTIHDIRRTVATGMQRLGVASDMIEVVQGRTKKLGAGMRYQRYDYLAEKRAVLSLWSGHVQALATKEWH